jgi:hypothetical protein
MHKYLMAMGVTAVAALTLLSGVIQGTIRHRWRPPAKMVEAAERLKEIPTQFGRWKLVKEKDTEEMDRAEVEMLEAASYTVHVYRSDELHEEVAVTLLLGPSGPIAAHTPDICLPSHAYKIRGDRKLVSLAGGAGASDSFWSLAYQETSEGGRHRRICYAWSNGGSWKAPEHARFTFAGNPYLYKIQVVGNASPGVGESESDACRKFLRDFVPKLRECLVPPDAP